MSSSSSLLHLPRDLLLDILTWFSVNDLLVAERTCKNLHSLCWSREIWVSLLKSLDIVQAPSFAPYERIEALSTNDIRHRVVRALKSSRGWTAQGALRPTTLATFELRKRVLPNGLRFFSRLRPQVVSGGQYVIVENQGQIELWSVRYSERLWFGPGLGEPLYCHSFGSEIQQEGNVLVVAAAYVNYLSGKSFICVHRICLLSLDSKEVSRKDILMPFLAPITVRGDIIIIRHPIDYIIYLCNWKSGEVVALNLCVDTKVNATAACITESHLLVVLHVGAFTLLAIQLSSIERHMSKASASCEIAQLDINIESATSCHLDPADGTGLDILRINLAEPREPSKGPLVITMHSFTPRWKNACEANVPEEIFIVGVEKSSGSSQSDVLLSWRLQLTRITAEGGYNPCWNGLELKSANMKSRVFHSITPWCLQLVATGRAHASMLPWNTHTISVTGRMLSFYKGLNSFKLFSDEPQPIQILKDTDEEITDRAACYQLESLDPYSGVLAIRTPDRVKIIDFV